MLILHCIHKGTSKLKPKLVLMVPNYSYKLVKVSFELIETFDQVIGAQTGFGGINLCN